MVREITQVEPPIGIFHAATEIQRQFESVGYKFCFIGGLAFQHWGNPRYTQDVDLTLLCRIGDEAKMVTQLASWFESRLSEPLAFSIRSRIYLAKLADGTSADIALV